MLSASAKKELEDQHYIVVGEHSAVKTCSYTKNMIKGINGCYKLKFYGIASHQCMQMTTSISCANRCTFCWRGYKAPVSKEWKWGVDDPKMIFGQSLKAHHKLLAGFGGNPASNKNLYNQSKNVKHVALSLTGEPITYPKINELLDIFNKNGVSTFLVTNAQFPEAIKNLKPVTQLYLSLDAPTKELLKKIDVPLFADYWERLNESLKILSQKKGRTTIRLTHIKGLNDCDEQDYVNLIRIGNPDFIEIKGYSYVGASRKLHTKEQMPQHENVVAWAKKIAELLPEYEIVTDHVSSAVVLLAKKEFKKNGVWYTWIDFKKWFELVNSQPDPSKFDFMFKTPKVGLENITTSEYRSKDAQKRNEYKKKIKENPVPFRKSNRVISQVNN